MQIKCGGENFPAVDAYEIKNRIGTEIVEHVWIGKFRIWVELGKYGLPPVGCRAPT